MFAQQKQMLLARKKLKKRVRPALKRGKKAYRKKLFALALNEFTLVAAIDPKNKEAP